MSSTPAQEIARLLPTLSHHPHLRGADLRALLLSFSPFVPLGPALDPSSLQDISFRLGSFVPAPAHSALFAGYELLLQPFFTELYVLVTRCPDRTYLPHSPRDSSVSSLTDFLFGCSSSHRRRPQRLTDPYLPTSDPSCVLGLNPRYPPKDFTSRLQQGYFSLAFVVQQASPTFDLVRFFADPSESWRFTYLDQYMLRQYVCAFVDLGEEIVRDRTRLCSVQRIHAPPEHLVSLSSLTQQIFRAHRLYP